MAYCGEAGGYGSQGWGFSRPALVSALALRYLFMNVCGREVPKGLPSILIILIEANFNVVCREKGCWAQPWCPDLTVNQHGLQPHLSAPCRKADKPHLHHAQSQLSCPFEKSSS